MYRSHIVCREQVRAQRTSDAISIVVIGSGTVREDEPLSNTIELEPMTAGDMRTTNPSNCISRIVKEDFDWLILITVMFGNYEAVVIYKDISQEHIPPNEFSTHESDCKRRGHHYITTFINEKWCCGEPKQK